MRFLLDEFKIKPVVLKLEEDALIMKEDEVILSLRAGTYAVPIEIKNQKRGVVFYGEGDYLVNSRLKTEFGVYSKQYVDKIRGLGIIIGKREKWENIAGKFVKTQEFPKGFENQDDFIERAKEELHYLLKFGDEGEVKGADWFFKVKGEMDEATLYDKQGKFVFKGCKAKLARKNEEEVVLKERETNLVLRGNKIVLKSDLERLIVSNERAITRKTVIGFDKIITKSFIGIDEDMAKEMKLKALSALTEALEKIGYVREA